MKKLIAMLMLGLSIGAAAQEKEYSDQELVTMMAPAGQVHNELVDELFSVLKQTYGSVYAREYTQANRTELLQVIDKNIVVLINRKMAIKGIDIEKVLINNMNDIIATYVALDVPGQVHVIDREGKLSPQYYEAMSSLGTLMTSNIPCLDESAFRKVALDKIGALPSYEEKIQLAVAASIAYNSMQYWKENRSKWQAFFAGGSTSKEGPGKEIAAADVTGIIYGAVTGGTWGAIGGTATFPVVGTITGAAGGAAAGAVIGGVTGSVKAAISSLVNWLIGK